MRNRASRGLRVAAGAGIGAIGLGIVALASGGSAFAASNPAGVTGTLGVTTGNPINVSASVPTAITVSIGANSGGVSFGTVQPGASGTGTISDTVTSNDPAGYQTALFGTNDGTNWLAGSSATASCPESISPVAPGTAGGVKPASGAALTAYAPTGGVARPVVTQANTQIQASGAFDKTGTAAGDLWYDPTGTVGGTVGSESLVQAYIGTNAAAVTATSPAWNKGLTSVTCSFTGAYNSSGGSYVGTDTFGLASLPWAALSATNGGGTGNTAFSENDTEGTYSDAQQGPTPITLVTNPLMLDSKSTVSGTAGSTTNTTDTYTDTLNLNVPGNQAAGSYQAALDLLIWGN